MKAKTRIHAVRKVVGAALAVPVLLAGLAFPAHAAADTSVPRTVVKQSAILAAASSPTTATPAQIKKAISAVRAKNVWLGAATGLVKFNPGNTGAIKAYKGGSIVWSASGAYALKSVIRDAYLRTGGRQWLNFPTSAEVRIRKGGGSVQRFTDGDIYWSPRTGAHKVLHAYGYKKLGGVNGKLGYPTTDGIRGSWGYVPLKRGHVNRQYFQGGLLEVTTRGATAVYRK
ncbi:MAG: LGFP repeat-containing protein [Actinomycetota bacterium]